METFDHDGVQEVCERIQSFVPMIPLEESFYLSLDENFFQVRVAAAECPNHRRSNEGESSELPHDRRIKGTSNESARKKYRSDPYQCQHRCRHIDGNLEQVLALGSKKAGL